MFGGKKKKADKKAARRQKTRGKKSRQEIAEAEGEVIAQIRPDGDFFANIAACFKNSRQNILTILVLVVVLAGLAWMDTAIPGGKYARHIETPKKETQSEGAAVEEARPENPPEPEEAYAEEPPADTEDQAEEGEEPDAGETEDRPPADMSFISVPAVAARASSVLNEPGYNYEPMNVADGDLASCWAFRGSEASIDLALDGTYELVALALCNGYGMDDTRYYNNNRVTGMRIRFSDGSSEELFVDPGDAAADFAARELTLVYFGQPHTADSVRIEILDTVRGERFNDTCLSELLLLSADNGQTVADLGEMIALPGGGLAPAADFIFPYSSTQSLSDADLDALCSGLDSGTARMVTQRALNEIYARYGYNFHPEKSDTAADAYTYFHSKDWYNAICVGTPWDNTGAVPVNSIENGNINLIAAWQRRHGMR